MSKDTKEDDGFVEVEQEDLPDIINFDETPVVVGTLLKFKTITIDRKKVEAAILEHEDTRFGVWMSAGLVDLKKFTFGTVVKIKSLGLEKVKRGTGHWRKFFISYNPATGSMQEDK